jgi:ABC-type transport system involved in Fe-S cluster assembly fused permease/ATPase subunit
VSREGPISHVFLLPPPQHTPGIATIKITLWRKKFREQANKSDNLIHERATDSLTCYETVKCFTNEPFELQRFRDAVTTYQRFSISTQASLSLLNIIQQVRRGLVSWSHPRPVP